MGSTIARCHQETEPLRTAVCARPSASSAWLTPTAVSLCQERRERLDTEHAYLHAWTRTWKLLSNGSQISKDDSAEPIARRGSLGAADAVCCSAFVHLVVKRGTPRPMVNRTGQLFLPLEMSWPEPSYQPIHADEGHNGDTEPAGGSRRTTAR